MTTRTLFIIMISFLSSHSFCQPLIVDKAGNAIGLHLDTYQREDSGKVLHVLSPNDYTFMLGEDLRQTGEFSAPGFIAYVTNYWIGIEDNARYYESNNCSGQAYLLTHSTGFATTVNLWLDALPPNQDIWYVPKDEVIENQVVTSRNVYSGHPENCEQIGGQIIPAARVFPNDPAITAISPNAFDSQIGGSFDAPMSIVSGLDSARASCIFRSGFECTIFESK